MNAIYETKGRAREFCELACNLYTGCGHRCVYCYAPDVLHRDKKVFHNVLLPRTHILDAIEHDASALKQQGEKRSVLLCFTCDPYQPVDVPLGITREAIKILHAHGFGVEILTKGGKRALRDFDLLGCPNDAFATTLTCLDEHDSLVWEPGAALPEERIESLMEAHRQGIKTWVSLEPVIYLEATLGLIKLTHTFVDHYKVGTMNYHPHGKTIPWDSFCWDVMALLDELHCRYYIKKDLAKYVGKPGGIRKDG